MHGGSTGSGAPTGNQNSVKHGFYTKEKREERREMIHLWREAQNYINNSRAKKRTLSLSRVPVLCPRTIALTKSE